jgi:hypothetical protein
MIGLRLSSMKSKLIIQNSEDFTGGLKISMMGLSILP